MASPLDYFDNEWFKFGLVFVILFWIIYKYLDAKWENNKGVAGIVAGGFSLILTIPITKKDWLGSLFNESIIEWIVIIAVIIALLFLFRWLFKRMKIIWGLIIGLSIIAITPLFFNAEDVLPTTLAYGPIGDFFEIMQGLGPIAWIILIVIVLVFFWRWRRGRINRIPRRRRETFSQGGGI